MPAEVSQNNVNLLGHDALAESPIGRIITWATTYGRYIMVATEIVVLLAFLSRFSLDRKLTDLNESIEQKRVIIEANQPFEKEIKSLQERLSQIKRLLSYQNKPITLIAEFKSLLPSDVYFESYSYNNESVSVEAIAGSTQSFMVFMNNLQKMKQFSAIDIGDIKRQPLQGLVFKFTARTTPDTVVTKSQPKTP